MALNNIFDRVTASYNSDIRDSYADVRHAERKWLTAAVADGAACWTMTTIEDGEARRIPNGWQPGPGDENSPRRHILAVKGGFETMLNAHSLPPFDELKSALDAFEQTVKASEPRAGGQSACLPMLITTTGREEMTNPVINTLNAAKGIAWSTNPSYRSTVLSQSDVEIYIHERLSRAAELPGNHAARRQYAARDDAEQRLAVARERAADFYRWRDRPEFQRGWFCGRLRTGFGLKLSIRWERFGTTQTTAQSILVVPSSDPRTFTVEHIQAQQRARKYGLPAMSIFGIDIFVRDGYRPQRED